MKFTWDEADLDVRRAQFRSNARKNPGRYISISDLVEGLISSNMNRYNLNEFEGVLHGKLEAESK